MIIRLLSVLLCAILLTSCKIGNTDWKYIYENKCILTGKTETKTEQTTVWIPIDTYGTLIPIESDDTYTLYEYQCSNGKYRSSLKYDITKGYQ